MNGKCLIFSAPSGSGKTTIVRYLLLQSLNLEFSVSATSRKPREGEVNGKDYYFLSADLFREKIDKGEFIEWEEVYEGTFYGTFKNEVERIWEKGNHVIFDVDVAGSLNLKKVFGKDALSIFIQPPSIQELENRLRNRSTENEESLRKRLDKANWELSLAPQFDVVIVNDNLEQACLEATEQVKKFTNQ
jgi:guanylate kinase